MSDHALHTLRVRPVEVDDLHTLTVAFSGSSCPAATVARRLGPGTELDCSQVACAVAGLMTGMRAPIAGAAGPMYRSQSISN